MARQVCGVNEMRRTVKVSPAATASFIERRQRYHCLHWLSLEPVPEKIKRAFQEMDRRIDDPNTTTITLDDKETWQLLGDPEELANYISFRVTPYKDVVCLYGDMQKGFAERLFQVLADEDVFEQGSACKIEEYCLAKILYGCGISNILVIQA